MDQIPTRATPVGAVGAVAVAVAAMIAVLAGCTSPDRSHSRNSSSSAIAVGDKRAFDACVKHYPNVRLAASSVAGDLRHFGPSVAKDLGNFAALPDTAYVAECLVPSSDATLDDVWGVPATGCAVEVVEPGRGGRPVHLSHVN